MALVLTIQKGDGPLHLIDGSTGEHIEVDMRIEHNQIKVAVTASDEITILRDVLYKRDQQNDRY